LCYKKNLISDHCSLFPISAHALTKAILMLKVKSAATTHPSNMICQILLRTKKFMIVKSTPNVTASHDLCGNRRNWIYIVNLYYSEKTLTNFS